MSNSLLSATYNRSCSVYRQDQIRLVLEDRQVTPWKSNVPCNFTHIRHSAVRSDTGITNEVTGYIYIDEELQETDTILLDDGYFYTITEGGIEENRDPVIGTIESYKISVKKGRKYGCEQTQIS